MAKNDAEHTHTEKPPPNGVLAKNDDFLFYGNTQAIRTLCYWKMHFHTFAGPQFFPEILIKLPAD